MKKVRMVVLIGLITSLVYIVNEWKMLNHHFRSESAVHLMVVDLVLEWLVTIGSFLLPVSSVVSFILVSHTLNVIHGLIKKYLEELRGAILES